MTPKCHSRLWRAPSLTSPAGSSNDRAAEASNQRAVRGLGISVTPLQKLLPAELTFDTLSSRTWALGVPQRPGGDGETVRRGTSLASSYTAHAALGEGREGARLLRPGPSVQASAPAPYATQALGVSVSSVAPKRCMGPGKKNKTKFQS